MRFNTHTYDFVTTPPCTSADAHMCSYLWWWSATAKNRWPPFVSLQRCACIWSLIDSYCCPPRIDTPCAGCGMWYSQSMCFDPSRLPKRRNGRTCKRNAWLDKIKEDTGHPWQWNHIMEACMEPATSEGAAMKAASTYISAQRWRCSQTRPTSWSSSNLNPNNTIEVWHISKPIIPDSCTNLGSSFGQGAFFSYSPSFPMRA
jgi:hypothetical protein